MWASVPINDGALEIASDSLSSLEMRESKVTVVTLCHAQSLEWLVAGMVSPNIKNPMWCGAA